MFGSRWYNVTPDKPKSAVHFMSVSGQLVFPGRGEMLHARVVSYDEGSWCEEEGGLAGQRERWVVWSRRKARRVAQEGYHGRNTLNLRPRANSMWVGGRPSKSALRGWMIFPRFHLQE